MAAAGKALQIQLLRRTLGIRIPQLYHVGNHLDVDVYLRGLPKANPSWPAKTEAVGSSHRHGYAAMDTVGSHQVCSRQAFCTAAVSRQNPVAIVPGIWASLLGRILLKIVLIVSTSLPQTKSKKVCFRLPQQFKSTQRGYQPHDDGWLVLLPTWECQRRW